MVVIKNNPLSFLTGAIYKTLKISGPKNETEDGSY